MYFVYVVHIRIALQHKLKHIFSLLHYRYLILCITGENKNFNTPAYVNVSGSIPVSINISDTEKVCLIHHLTQIFKFKNEYLNYVDSFKYPNLKADVWVGCSQVRVQIVRKLRQEGCLDSGIGAQLGKLSEASCPFT